MLFSLVNTWASLLKYGLVQANLSAVPLPNPYMCDVVSHPSLACTNIMALQTSGPREALRVGIFQHLWTFGEVCRGSGRKCIFLVEDVVW